MDPTKSVGLGNNIQIKVADTANKHDNSIPKSVADTSEKVEKKMEGIYLGPHRGLEDLNVTQLVRLKDRVEEVKSYSTGRLSHSERVRLSADLDKVSEAIEHAIVTKREKGKPVVENGHILFVKATSIPREELEERQRNNDVHYHFGNTVLINPNAPDIQEMENVEGAAIEGEDGVITACPIEHLTQEEVEKLSKVIKFHFTQLDNMQRVPEKSDKVGDQHAINENRTITHIGSPFRKEKKVEPTEEHAFIPFSKKRGEIDARKNEAAAKERRDQEKLEKKDAHIAEIIQKKVVADELIRAEIANHPLKQGDVKIM